MLVKFPCKDELVEFLPDRAFVQLMRFYHAVDRAEDIFFKQVLNLHIHLVQGTNLKAR